MDERDDVNYKLMGMRIREERQKHHYTQSALAEKVDLSTNYIGQIERGDRKASLASIYKICKTLGLTVDYVLSVDHDRAEDTFVQNYVRYLKMLDEEGRMFMYNMLISYPNPGRPGKRKPEPEDE